MNSYSLQLAQYVLIFLLVINVTYAVLGAVHTPLSHIDVIANWLYKAQVLYLDHGSINFLHTWQGEFAHPQYPLLLPYFFSFIYILVGQVAPATVSLISSLIYIFCIILCYFYFRKNKYNKLSSLAITYSYSMIPPLLAQAGREHAGMADIYICLLFWISLYVLQAAQKRHILNWLLVPIIIVASLIKTEGILLIIFLLIGKRVWNSKLLQIICASTGFLAWNLILHLYAIPASYSISIPTYNEAIVKTIVMFREMGIEFFLNFHNWYIFWPLFFLVIIFDIVSSMKEKRDSFEIQLYWLLFLLYVSICAMYIFSTTAINGYVSSSFDRLLLQSSPIWFSIFISNVRRLLTKQTFLVQQHQD